MSVVDRGWGGGGKWCTFTKSHKYPFVFDNLTQQILPLQIYTLHTELYSGGGFGKSYFTCFIKIV